MIGWIATTLATSTLLMLVVLLIRKPVARYFGARAAYALWLLPALRMVLPPVPELAIPLLAPMAPVIDVHTAVLVARDAIVPDMLAETRGDWLMIVLLVWVGVAAARFATTWFAYRRFMATALDGGYALPSVRGIGVHLSRRHVGPLAAGIFVRRIVLPADFNSRFDPVEQRLALSHEEAHHVRRDTIANVAALIVLALHWWNPLARMAWRAFRIDQELACDAVVLRKASAEERHAYGSALLKAAFGGTPAAVCGMARAAELKQRLRMMGVDRRSVLRTQAGAVLVGVVVLAGPAGPAAGSAAADSVRAFGDKVRLALPLAPAPPPSSPSIEAARRPAHPAKPPLSHLSGHTVAPPLAPQTTSIPPMSPLPPQSAIRFEDLATAPLPTPPQPLPVAVAAEAQAEIYRLNADEIVRASMKQARADLSATCAAAGISRDPQRSSWGELVACGRDAERLRASVMRDAQREVARAQREVVRAQRDQLRAALEHAREQLDDFR